MSEALKTDFNIANKKACADFISANLVRGMRIDDNFLELVWDGAIKYERERHRKACVAAMEKTMIEMDNEKT